MRTNLWWPASLEIVFFFFFFPQNRCQLHHTICIIKTKTNTLPNSKNSSANQMTCVYIVYTFKILSSLFPISMHVNSWQLTCSVMRLIPGARALFPDTDLQVQFVSLKNVSSHTTICLSFSLHLFLPIKFQKLWTQKTAALFALHTNTRPQPRASKSSAPRDHPLLVSEHTP